MDTITPAQECTLRNWVLTFQRRPGKLEKAFLQADKGLSEQQIDAWLEKEENNTYSEEVMTDSILPQGSMNAIAMAENVPLPDSLNFDTLSSDPMDLLPTDATPFWPSVGQFHETYPCASADDMSQHIQSWQSLENYRQDLSFTDGLSHVQHKSTTSDVLDSHWTYMSDSDRSSGVSFASSRTWDTASTVASFPDVCFDNNEDQSLAPKTEQSSFSRRSSKASSRHKHSSSFDINSIPEEDVSRPYATSHLELNIPTATHTDSGQAKALNKPLPKAEKGPAIYRCTACPSSFSRKWEWKRHEDSQHDPQTYWTCMLGDPAVQTDLGWTCAFCDHTRTHRGEMVAHLVREHKINRCTVKPMANKTWTREDKLKQHLQQVHALSETASRWKSWQHPAVQKAAWGCGYCGACSFTWEGRLSHIAEHYEGESSFKAPWSINLVVKGLLKQCQREFNIAKAWKELIGRAPNRDRQMTWSVKDAAVLKRKLEFHEGTPEELAKEGKKLAIVQFAPALQVWLDADLKTIAAIDPALLKQTQKTNHPSVSTSDSKWDIKMQDNITNCI